MSEAVVRKIDLRLERLIDSGAGPTVEQALAAARRNLQDLRGPCLRTLDERLARLAGFLESDPVIRPPDSVLDTLAGDVDAALTACTVLDMPIMANALLMLAGQIDALRHSSRWPAGALDPAIHFVGLVRTGRLNDQATQKVMKELTVCLEQYSRFAEPT